MSDRVKLNDELSRMLGSVLDARLEAVGFSRRENSLVYARRSKDAEHRITFSMEINPDYQPGAIAHICPSLQVLMENVSDAALELVKGSRMLLGHAPEIIIGQPIEFVAPKTEHERWFVNTAEDFRLCCERITAFLFKWVIPFLADISTAHDLIRLHESNDPRVVKTDTWYIYVASAHYVLAQPDNARSVIEGRFGRPGMRKRYACLFENGES